MLNIKNYKNVCFNILLFLLIGLGIYLRASLYFMQIPFWYDERILGVHFFDNNIFKFFFSISDLVKIPPLWGIVNHIFLSIFGHSFLAFRFIPLISGIFSIIAFSLLLKTVFKDKIAILTGLLLFSTNPWLIYYSCEFRPYSSDVLICILLLLSFKFLSFKNISFRKTILYTLISGIIILFSFPAIFIIPALILTKCIEEKHFNPKILLIFFGICTVCLYLYMIDNNCYSFMKNFWQSELIGFLKPSFNSFNSLINCLVNYIFWVDLNQNHFFIKYFALAGLLFFFLNKQKEAFILFFIILFALSASFLKIYPFGYRVSLYLIPIFLILIAKVIDFYPPPPHYSNKNGILITLKSVLISILILYLTQFNTILETIEGIRYSMEFLPLRFATYEYSKNILREIENQDIIILPVSMESSIRFYNKFFKENKEIELIKYNNLTENLGEAERELINTNLNKFDHSSNIWILGKYQTDWDISADNFNIVEDELKKHNLKYTKDIDKLFYSFKVDKEDKDYVKY